VNARVCFRVDASVRIGSGHVMRCLAIADALSKAGVGSRFVCREHERHLGERIRDSGHALTLLAPSSQNDAQAQHLRGYEAWLGAPWHEDLEQTLGAMGAQPVPSWFVIDHYGIDARWERGIAQATRNILVIDDLADRDHHCNLLLDAGVERQAAAYDLLVPEWTERLVGPEFALLRPSFAQWREASLRRRREPVLKKILVSFGGADADNITERALDALDACALPEDCRIVVVSGPLSPWGQRLAARAARMRRPCDVATDVRDMASLMLECDVAIGAAGGTALERCAMGLPSIIVVMAENQREGAEALLRRGAAAVIPHPDGMRDALPSLLASPTTTELLQALARQSALVTDGRGVDRLVAAMERQGW
jgi:UDP-2,4-diacetamido-2,4,6-trideoxy-beta-L-altropyranose hydrolase